MNAVRSGDKPYLDTVCFRCLRLMAAAFLALYGSYYVKEAASLLLRLGMTAGFFACLLGLGLWCGRFAFARRCRLYALGLALICTGSLRLFTPVSKSVFWLLLYAGIFLLLDKALRRAVERRVAAAAGLLGCLFSLATLMGCQLRKEGRLSLLYLAAYTKEQAFQWLWFAGFALLLSALFVLLLPRMLDGSAAAQSDGEVKRFPAALTAGGLLLCWLPYYIAFYPGCLSADSLWELQQQLGLRALSNHHPVMHQMFLRLGLTLGRAFGSLTLGVGVYSLLQMLLMAVVFALCLRFLARCGAGKELLWAVFLFYGLYSIHAFYSISMWKDVPFAAAALLLVLLLSGRLPWEWGTGKRRRVTGVLLLTAVSFFFCTLRSNGFYAFLLGFPCYLLANRRQWRPLACAGLLTVLLVLGYQTLLYDGLGVTKPGAGEALSVPLQQIARTVKLHGADETDADMQILREVFPDLESLGERYNSGISDPVKDGEVFLARKFAQAPLRYGGAWLRLGLRHPLSYLDAFLLQNYGYWYPDLDYFNVEPGILENTLGLRQQPRLAPLREKLVLLHDNLAVYRPSAVLYSIGFLVWLALLGTVLLGMKRQRRAFSAGFLIWAVWLSTLASPVFCEYRYLYSLVVCVPLFLGQALCLPDRGGKVPKRGPDRENGENEP